MSEKLLGYNGKIAYIDLSTSKVEIKSLDPKIAEDYMSKMDQLVLYAENDYTSLSSTRGLSTEAIRKLFEISYENKLEDLMDLFYK